VQNNREPLRIGTLTVDPPTALAPMAGVTNHAFRIICRRLGAGIVYTEMISSYALHFRNSKTSRMLDWTPEERPVAAQIFGDDPEIMAEAAGIVADAGADVIDMNFGSGRGSDARRSPRSEDHGGGGARSEGAGHR